MAKATKKTQSIVTTSNFTSVVLPQAFMVEAEEFFTENKLSADFIGEHQSLFLGGVPITIGDLLRTADTESFQQTEINPSKVKAIIASGMTGEPFQLLQPIEVGFDESFLTEDGDLADGAVPHSVLGGRHRLASIVAMYRFSGYDDAEIEAVEIATIAKFTRDENHTARLILASNASRNMAPVEKLSLKLQQLGVSFSAGEEAIDSITNLLNEKRLRKSDAVQSYAVYFRQSEESLGENVDALSEGTYLKLVSTVYTSVASQLSGELKKIALSNDGIITIVEVIVGYLDDALGKFYKAIPDDAKGDVRNLQRAGNAGKVAGYITGAVVKDVSAEFAEAVAQLKAEKEAARKEQAKKLQAAREAKAAAAKSAAPSTSKAPKATKAAKAAKVVEEEVDDEEVEEDIEEVVEEVPTKKAKRPSAPKAVQQAVEAAPSKTRAARRK